MDKKVIPSFIDAMAILGKKKGTKDKQEADVIDVFRDFASRMIGHVWSKQEISTHKRIDRYNEIISWEYKHSSAQNFVRNKKYLIKTLAQIIYYLHDIYSGVPSYLNTKMPKFYAGVCDKGAFIVRVCDLIDFYTLEDSVIDWSLQASSPDKVLQDIIEQSQIVDKIKVYDFSDENDVELFFERLEFIFDKKEDAPVMKKQATISNILHFYKKWKNTMFGIVGNCTQETRKHIKERRILEIRQSYNFDTEYYSSIQRECFLADLKNGGSYYNADTKRLMFKIKNDKWEDIEVGICVSEKSWNKLWENMCKIDNMTDELMLYVDELLENDDRRKGGDYYTREDFVKRSDKFVSKCINPVLNTNSCDIWNLDWDSGNYRYIGLAAGRGTLEWNMPKHIQKYAYVSTKRDNDVEFVKGKMPDATVFQYDNLVDDIQKYKDGMTDSEMFNYTKAPKNFIEDLKRFKNGELTFIIVMNPPYFVGSDVYIDSENKSLDEAKANDSLILDWMKGEKVSDTKGQVYVQFIYRVKKEFSGGKAILCLYSPCGFLTYNDYNNFRNDVFKSKWLGGYVFNSNTFRGTSSSTWDVLYSVWDLNDESCPVSGTTITAEYIDNDCKNTDTYKQIKVSSPSSTMQGYIKQNEKKTIPVRCAKSAFAFVESDKKTIFRGVTEDYVACIRFEYNYGDVRRNLMLSVPGSSCRHECITEENFNECGFALASSNVLPVNRKNKSNVMMKPNRGLTNEEITDCWIYAFMCKDNHVIPYINVPDMDADVIINNNIFPFSISQVDEWIGVNGYDNFQEQIDEEKDDRFFYKWLTSNEKYITKEGNELLEVAKEMYKTFYENRYHISGNVTKYRVHDRWDVGFKQVYEWLSLSDEDEIIELVKRCDNLRSQMANRIRNLSIELGVFE